MIGAPIKQLHLMGTTANTSASDFSLNAIPTGNYYVQIFWDQDFEESRITVPGNLYSLVGRIVLDKNKSIDLELFEEVPKRSLVDNQIRQICRNRK